MNSSHRSASPRKLHIGEISKIYHVPVTTLHYWEREGLFQTEKNADSGYREFSPSHTLVELGDVVFYRNIDVPLKELKTIGNQNAEQLKALIEQSRNRIVSEMESLRKKTEVIDRRLAVIDEIIRSQREITFAEGAPPFQKAILFQYDNAEFIARYLQNPNDFVIVGKPEDGLKVLNCLSVPADDCNGSPVWQADDKRYIMSHFKVKLYDVNTTDFFRVTDALKERGYRPKSYIAQFLINMSDGSTRYDYYRIWYEV